MQTATKYRMPSGYKINIYKKKDITIRFIPNLLSEEGRTLQAFPFNRDWTIRKYLKKAGIPFEGMYIAVNGNDVKSISRHLNIGDEIMVMPDIKIPSAAVWAAMTFWGKVFTVALIAGTAASIGYSVYQAIAYQTPKMPSFDTVGEGMDAESPTHSWDGIRTTSDFGRPIPIIYGERAVGGNVINEYISTDGDKSFLNTLLSVCHGEVESVTLRRINRNPAENYSDYNFNYRLGTNTQTVIKHFEDIHRLKSLSIEITKDNAYTYTSENSDVEAFEIHLQLPSGLWQQDSAGSILSYDVIYKVEYKLHTEETWTDLGSTTISAKSRSALKRIFRKDSLTAGQYDIRITKTSNDSDFSHTSDIYVQYIDEINTDDQEFPTIALAAIRALGTDQLSNSFPDYEILVKGRKVMVPKVMNGESEVPWDDYYWDPDSSCYRLFSDNTALTWDEETFITRYSANPIWCTYDLMTFKRAGLGYYIVAADHNLNDLVGQSQYCEERVPDGLGGWEKRFRMDVVIDSPQGALDLIVQLCSIFRALPSYSDKGQIKLTVEKPDIPVQLFNPGNIIEKSFSESWGSIRDVPNIVHVQFDDEDNNYETTTVQAAIDEAAIAAGKPLNIKTIRYYGTKLSYALRHGRNYLLVCKHITNTIRFSAGMAALTRQAAELIDIAHDVPQWGFGGRIQADSTASLIKLDREVIIESGKTYKIRIDFTNGNYEERTVTDSVGTYTEVNVNPAFSGTPVEYKDVYSFGEVDKVVKPARIIALKRQRNGSIGIEAIEYNEDIFDDTAVVIPQKKYSSLSTDVPDVTNLKLTERLVKMADGTIENAIDVWFDKPDMTSYMIGNFTKARIYLSDNAGNSWESVGETTGRHFTIVGNLKDLKTYKVAVVSANITGEKAISSSPQDNITILGDTVVPGNVPAFLVNQSRDRLYMGWSSVTDVRVLDYEIRYGASWETGQVITAKRDTTHIELNFRVGAGQKFFIKAKTRSGRYSQTATEATITIDNIPFTNIIESYQEQTAWAGDKSNTVKVGDNLEISAGELSGTYTTLVRDISYVATFKIGVETVVVDATSGDATWDQEPATAKWNELSDTERWSGQELSGAVSFEIRTSEDNVTWSDWKQWQAGDYKCRYFQLRMTLTRSDPSKTIQCPQLNYYADLPDVDEKNNDEVTVAADGKEVIFTKTFHEPPSVNIDILSGDAFLHKFSVIPTITGFTVKLYDLAGVVKTGQFSYHAHGL